MGNPFWGFEHCSLFGGEIAIHRKHCWKLSYRQLTKLQVFICFFGDIGYMLQIPVVCWRYMGQWCNRQVPRRESRLAVIGSTHIQMTYWLLAQELDVEQSNSRPFLGVPKSPKIDPPIFGELVSWRYPKFLQLEGHLLWLGLGLPYRPYGRGWSIFRILR
jgi:hypothetical protein